MKRVLALLIVVLMGSLSMLAQNAGGNAALEKVLTSMDHAAQDFRSAQADFTWDTYQAVVRENNVQKGTMYFRRVGNNVEVAADINWPADQQQYLVVAGGKAQIYQPRIDQVTQYSLGKNRDAFESFLVLGFGGRGHDLSKQFGVRYIGNEKVGGIDAAKLELTPKSSRVRGMFERILLWIDPAQGVSVQQQFWEPQSGNYKLIKYTNIKQNKDIPASVFKLKTTSKTKVVSN